MRSASPLICALLFAAPAAATGVDVVEEGEALKVVHVAVRDLEVSGFDARKARIATEALLVELRKLQRVSVISMGEIRALLENEAERQAVGCEEESCLSEIADAVGADVLLTGSIAVVGEETVFGLKRLSSAEAKVEHQFSKRLSTRTGEEVLAAIGPAVKALFPERGLRKGVKRGVDDRVALALNPPPLDPAVPVTAAITAGVAGLGAALAGAANLGLNAQLNERLTSRGSAAAPSPAEVEDRTGLINLTAVSFYGLAGVAVVAGAAAGVSALFTDWEGLREESVDAE